MVVTTSSSRQIEALLADLSAGQTATRDAAIARLTVIGPRAVDRLVVFAGDTAQPASARVAALRALEAIGDARTVDAALKAIDDGDTAVRVAAIGLAGAFLTDPRGAGVLDRLTGIALNRQAPEPVRLVAVRALLQLQPATLQPLLEALGDDPSPDIRALSKPGARRGARASPAQWLQQAVEAGLPDDVVALRRAVAKGASTLPLTLLHQLIERIREREGLEPGPRRVEWTAARAAVHAALAERGSRLALYDVRETLESASAPLPVEFLKALAAIGDASCLEAIATAYARTPDAGRAPGDWWRRHLIDTFRAIVARERMTRRHAVVKKIEKRWRKDVFEELWP